jgi:hypothetical protein
MEQEYFHSRKDRFERLMMTGVFVGLITTVLVLIYDVFFVQNEGLPAVDYFFNVTMLIFGINLLFFALGPLYYGLLKLSRYGEIIYIALIVAATVFLLLKIKNADRTDDDVLNAQFRELQSGVVILVAIGACILLPVLYHNRKFEKKML